MLTILSELANVTLVQKVWQFRNIGGDPARVIRFAAARRPGSFSG
jgi:hypothetical protein